MRLSTLALATTIAAAGAVVLAPHPALADDPDLAAISQQLKLSPDQQKKVRAIQDDLHKSIARTRAAIEVSSIDLRRELDKDSPDEKKAGRYVDDIARMEGEARKRRIFAMLRIKKLLTTEQRKELGEMGPIATGPSPTPTPTPTPVWGRSATPPVPPVPPVPAVNDNDNDFGFDASDFDFDASDFDPGDFDIDFDVSVDGVKLSAEVRKEIEQAKEEAKRARKEALKAAKEAQKDAMRSARDAMRDAARARRDAMREAKRAFEEAKRSGHMKGGSFTVTTRQHNSGAKNNGPSQVVIEAQPGAAVYVDGKKKGNTPMRLKLSKGRHTIEARWNGKKHKTVVNITGGDMVVLNFQKGND